MSSEELEKKLLKQYGPLVTGDLLVQLLGFRTPQAYRKAVSRGTIAVPLFQLPNHRGRYALTVDIAKWLMAHYECAQMEKQPGNEKFSS